MRSDMPRTALMRHRNFLAISSDFLVEDAKYSEMIIVWYGQQGKVELTGPKEHPQSKSTDIKQKRLSRHSSSVSTHGGIKATKNLARREFHSIISARLKE